MPDKSDAILISFAYSPAAFDSPTMVTVAAAAAAPTTAIPLPAIPATFAIPLNLLSTFEAVLPSLSSLASVAFSLASSFAVLASNSTIKDFSVICHRRQATL